MKLLLSLLLICNSNFFLTAQNIPIDFEENGNGADWQWRTFENLNNPPLEIVPNPDSSEYNQSKSVAKFTALRGGQAFAGCESLHGADIGSFTIDANNSIIRYDQIVIFPDFDNRNNDNIIYFDDIYSGINSSANSNLANNLTLKLYPNPSNNIINIVTDLQLNDYQVYSMEGILVKEQTLTKDNFDIDIAELVSGSYFIKLTYPHGIVTKTFLKI